MLIGDKEIRNNKEKEVTKYMKKYRIGYTQGVFDMFHIGHLNLLNEAKKRCDILIVGVNSDELVKDYKNKEPIINQNDRRSIVENIKAVDKAIIVDTLDKFEIYKNIDFNAIFIGDDWKNNPRWLETKENFEKIDIDVVFLPYTKNISSTELRNKIQM